MLSHFVKRHLDAFWPGQDKDCFTWKLGPIKEVLPLFTVCRIRPRSVRDPWVYVTVGACDVDAGEEPRMEFFLLAPDDNARHIETLAMVAHFHATTRNKLDVGRIIVCGRGWLEGSPSDHLLVSLPYPFGPTLEWCKEWVDKDIRFLWLVPITPSEAAFAMEKGVESLERRFDENTINAVDPMRKPVA
jgi:Suppressor of fused protein (SUFU)